MARPEANPWATRNNWTTFLADDGETDGDLVILPPTTERTQDGIKTITSYKEDVEENGEVKYYEVIESSLFLQREKTDFSKT